MNDDAEIDATRKLLSEKEVLFKSILAQHGRPTYVESFGGMRMIDLICRSSEDRAVLQPAPWSNHLCHHDMPIVQLNAYEYKGWWAEVSPTLLLHAKFDGEDGLTPLEAARVCAESPNPHPDLVEWMTTRIDHGHLLDVEREISENLKQHLSYKIMSRIRVVTICGDMGTEENPRFYLREYVPVND